MVDKALTNLSVPPVVVDKRLHFQYGTLHLRSGGQPGKVQSTDDGISLSALAVLLVSAATPDFRFQRVLRGPFCHRLPFAGQAGVPSVPVSAHKHLPSSSSAVWYTPSLLKIVVLEIHTSHQLASVPVAQTSGRMVCARWLDVCWYCKPCTVCGGGSPSQKDGLLLLWPTFPEGFG